MAAAYRPSSGAEWEGADRSAAAAEVSQGCGGGGGGSSPQGGMVWLQDGREGWKRPQEQARAAT